MYLQIPATNSITLYKDYPNINTGKDEIMELIWEYNNGGRDINILSKILLEFNFDKKYQDIIINIFNYSGINLVRDIIINLKLYKVNNDCNIPEPEKLYLKTFTKPFLKDSYIVFGTGKYHDILKPNLNYLTHINNYNLCWNNYEKNNDLHGQFNYFSTNINHDFQEINYNIPIEYKNDGLFCLNNSLDYNKFDLNNNYFNEDYLQYLRENLNKNFLQIFNEEINEPKLIFEFKPELFNVPSIENGKYKMSWYSSNTNTIYKPILEIIIEENDTYGFDSNNKIDLNKNFSVFFNYKQEIKKGELIKGNIILEYKNEIKTIENHLKYSSHNLWSDKLEYGILDIKENKFIIEPNKGTRLRQLSENKQNYLELYTDNLYTNRYYQLYIKDTENNKIYSTKYIFKIYD